MIEVKDRLTSVTDKLRLTERRAALVTKMRATKEVWFPSKPTRAAKKTTSAAKKTTKRAAKKTTKRAATKKGAGGKTVNAAR